MGRPARRSLEAPATCEPVRRWTLYVPLLAISLVFFVMAALADNYAIGFLLAICGALVPAAGGGLLIVLKVARWRTMAKGLGLVKKASGMYPDLTGKYHGLRLTVLRRIDPYARGVRDSTVLRLEGHNEVRLPGTVTDAAVVHGVLAPLLESSPEDD